MYVGSKFDFSRCLLPATYVLSSLVTTVITRLLKEYTVKICFREAYDFHSCVCDKFVVT